MSTPRTRRSRFSRTGQRLGGERGNGVHYSVLKLSGSLVFYLGTSRRTREVLWVTIPIVTGCTVTIGIVTHKAAGSLDARKEARQVAPVFGSPEVAAGQTASARRNALLTHCGRFRPRIGCSLKPRACPRRAAREGKPPAPASPKSSGTNRAGFAIEAISGPLARASAPGSRISFSLKSTCLKRWRYAASARAFAPSSPIAFLLSPSHCNRGSRGCTVSTCTPPVTEAVTAQSNHCRPARCGRRQRLHTKWADAVARKVQRAEI